MAGLTSRTGICGQGAGLAWGLYGKARNLLAFQGCDRLDERGALRKYLQ